MPTKTIDVSDADLPLYQRAEDLTGGNLATAVATALGRFVEQEERRRDGFEEIILRVGRGAGRNVRFTGTLLGEWSRTAADNSECVRVFLTRKGKFVVHRDRSDDCHVSAANSHGSWWGWRSYLGFGEYSCTFVRGTAGLDVADSLAELRDLLPAELYDRVAVTAEEPTFDDLDI
jgi:EXLDI family protein